MGKAGFWNGKAWAAAKLASARGSARVTRAYRGGGRAGSSDQAGVRPTYEGYRTAVSHACVGGVPRVHEKGFVATDMTFSKCRDSQSGLDTRCVHVRHAKFASNLESGAQSV